MTLGGRLALGLLFCAAAFQCMSGAALADLYYLTLEAHAPSTFPKVTTVIDLADPNDQLAVSIQATYFAMASDGWDLASFGAVNEVKGPPYWSAPISMMAVPATSEELTALMGYELNEEARTYGPFYELWFHTDAWAARSFHEIGESPNNYGTISGVLSGIYGQCPVPDWGTFSVKPIPEPASLICGIVGLGTLAAYLKRRGRQARGLPR